MSNGRVEFVWGDGEHVFNIARFAQAIELEEKCGCGVAEVYQRLRSNLWRINDVRETLRLGLIGGGLEPGKAVALVKRYFDERPWTESVQPAILVLMSAMVGVPGDEVGKKPQAEGTTAEEGRSSDQMDASFAPQSTGLEPQ